MNYGSVCSGIEAATVAWEPLGWKAQFYSEIEAFPCSALAQHYPEIPNLGDMTKFKEWPDAAIDVLVGGTPCQSYSVAGLRKGLDDPRGNLMLTYVAIARRYRPRWLVWENVPGVLSSNKGRDFGSLLGLLTGQHIECPPGGWQNSGVVPGYKNAYGVAWRVLDAQFVRVESHPRAVPQRRRRVFLVGYLGDWRRAAAVLFERESMSGHPAPSRKAGQETAGYTPSSFGSYSEGCGTLRKEGGDLGGGSESLIVAARESGQGYWLEDEISGPLRAEGENRPSRPSQMMCMSTGQAGADIGVWPPEVAPCLDTTFGSKYGQDNQHIDGGAGLFTLQDGRGLDKKQNGKGWDDSGVGYTLDRVGQQAIAFQERGGRKDGRVLEIGGEVAYALTAPKDGGRAQERNICHGYTVRRLTPLECARLQGFSDRHLHVVKHKGKPAADGPMYKAFGNSMAANVMSFLGRRIQTVEDMFKEA